MAILVICDNKDREPAIRQTLDRMLVDSIIVTSEYFSDASLDSSYLGQIYDILLMTHAKRILPKETIKKIPCFNLHPGIRRGMFSHVYDILEGTQTGATLHEIDEKIDHGAIIDQRFIDVEITDTSESVYNKILELEIQILKDNIHGLIDSRYKRKPGNTGKLHTRKEFDNLCRIDMNEKDTFWNFYNKLRALSHSDYKNAYFDENGKRIHIKIEIL